MSCKYKKFDTPCFCQVIQGECQFMISPHDDCCPILDAYKDFDKYWLETNKDNQGNVKIDNLKIEDNDIEADELDIQI